MCVCMGACVCVCVCVCVGACVCVCTVSARYFNYMHFLHYHTRDVGAVSA